MGVRRWLSERLGRRGDRPKPPKLEMVTRHACHLCDDMEEMLKDELPRLGVGWTKLDVDEHPALFERFNETVPVLLRDGQVVAKVRVSREQLVRIVRRRR